MQCEVHLIDGVPASSPALAFSFLSFVKVRLYEQQKTKRGLWVTKTMFRVRGVIRLHPEPEIQHARSLCWAIWIFMGGRREQSKPVCLSCAMARPAPHQTYLYRLWHFADLLVSPRQTDLLIPQLHLVGSLAN